MNRDNPKSSPAGSSSFVMAERPTLELSPFDIVRFKTAPYPCGYLPGQVATLEYRLIVRISALEYEQLLSRGWRRFGIDFFRPACPACTQCRSLRIEVARFAPSQSQRRTVKRNSSLRLVVQRPTCTPAHVTLWQAYHHAMQLAKGWPAQTITEAEYAEKFVQPPFDFAREFLYYDEERLVAVGLVDELPQSVSSIYFFHDPAYRRRALGVYSVLAELEYARQKKLAYSYLGYWVERCPSMAYKAQYQPHDLLIGSPRDSEPAEWQPRPALA